MQPAEPALDLQSIQAPAVVPTEPDLNTKKELSAIAHENNLRRLDVAERTLVLSQRRAYAKYSFLMVCAWLTGILGISLLQGMGTGERVFYIWHFPMRFQLDSKVLITLIATTTANIIAVLVIVMKFIFPTEQSKRAGRSATSNMAGSS